MDAVRQSALLILHEIDSQKAYMNILLTKKCREENFSGRDAAFLSELVKGTVRNRGYIDYIISLYSSVKLKKISPWIMNILRLGVYQLCFTDKIPVSAAVNESVTLAKRYGHRSTSGFVNAVLRKISSVTLSDIPLPEDKVKMLSVKYSYPEWMVERFIDNFGDRAEEVLAEGNGRAPTVIRANTLKITAKELYEKLSEYSESISGNMIRIKKGISPEKLAGFSEGLFTVQAEPFNLTAEVMELSPGMTVIDACAAPGGKTTYIAQLMKNEGTVWAFDIYEHKLKLINETSRRLGINIIKTGLHDASEPLSGVEAERILLDVPCSGLGIIRRRPDIKCNREKEDHSLLQKQIILNMAKNLKKGGIMVYSTCSIDRAENEDVIEYFLERNRDFHLIAFPGAEKGYRTFLPGEDNFDGAFICKLGRK